MHIRINQLNCTVVFFWNYKIHFQHIRVRPHGLCANYFPFRNSSLLGLPATYRPHPRSMRAPHVQCTILTYSGRWMAPIVHTTPLCVKVQMHSRWVSNQLRHSARRAITIITTRAHLRSFGVWCGSMEFKTYLSTWFSYSIDWLTSRLVLGSSSKWLLLVCEFILVVEQWHRRYTVLIKCLPPAPTTLGHIQSKRISPIDTPQSESLKWFAQIDLSVGVTLCLEHKRWSEGRRVFLALELTYWNRKVFAHKSIFCC